MQKWSYAFQLALAVVLGVPALTGQERDVAPVARPPATPAGLERSLTDTLRALETLAGFEARATAGDPRASARIRAATEPPIGGARERDAQLARLRDEVNRLQTLHDEAVAHAEAPRSPSTEAPVSAVSGSEPLDAVPTTGLREEERRALAVPGLESPAGTLGVERSSATSIAAGASGPADASATGAGVSIEALAADPLRQGQAYYRAGRYADCLARMQSLGDDVRARYWTGRALEKLERIDAAIAAYRAVAADRDAGYLAARAASDVEYLQWKLAHVERLRRRETRTPASSSPGAAADPGEGDAP